MRRTLLAVFVGVLCALCMFVALHRGAVDDMKYQLGLYDSAPDVQEIRDAIELFNRLYARFFATGGNAEGLSEFPAANMVKRRIFQDISNWKSQDKMLAYDKFEVRPTSVELMGPRRAVVVTQEHWSLLAKDIGVTSGEKSSKSLLIQVRYILSKVRGRWIVDEFEVFGPNDHLPSLADVWRS
jgi:hypothetical protein